MDKGDKAMKARIKTTGEIVDIAEYSTIYAENYDTCFYPNELEFLENSEDYWTRLEHTYVGMFMKSFLDNFDGTATMEQLSDDAIALAHALVQKLKEKEERK